MKYLIRALGFLIVPIIVNAVLKYISTPKKSEKGKVYLPKFYALLGIIASAVFLIPTLITAFTNESVWLSLGFLAFSLLGAVLIIAFINCRVEYDENGFTHRNFLGIKRTFTYDDVTHIREDMHEDCIFAGKHKIMIDGFAVGGAEFIGFVRKQYRKRHDGLPLPIIKKAKHDIFGGNVYDAGGFVFVYILLSVIILIFGIIIAYNIWLNPSTAKNTVEQTVIFEEAVPEDDKLVMTSSQGEVYKIFYYDDLSDAERIENLCDGISEVTVYSQHVTPEKAPDYMSLKAIKSGEDYILTFDETNRINTKNQTPIIIIPIVFALLWGLFVFLSIKVGRNPKKYKRFVKLFFKPEYIKK